MDFCALPYWLFDWKTGLFWGFGCLGAALWLMLFVIRRDLAEVKRYAAFFVQGLSRTAGRKTERH
jgi:hypothetical protein